jgi:spermidine synthase
VILFLELACIRWFGSTVPFLAYFSNVVLLASFLGMSAGCLLAGRRRDLAPWVLPIVFVSMCAAIGVEWAHERFGAVMIDVGGQDSPQQVFFGAEYVARNPGRFIIPIEAVCALFFSMVVAVFLGLGQELGRAFRLGTTPLASYTTNILGSLGGIVGFGTLSLFQAPPIAWFAVGGGLWLLVLRKRSATSAVALLMVLGVAWVEGPRAPGEQTLWSPYYRVRYQPRTHSLSVNNISHQNMIDIESVGAAYWLPHLLVRDAGGAPFRDVLVIGAGSGNDVAAALAAGAARVDAVDIEPAMISLGKAHHPNAPYGNPRARTFQSDGRSFLRRSQSKYDLIAYALPDSLMLHSGLSSLRLESFLFTKQAFADVRERLRPGGVFAVYNVYRQWWVAARVMMLAREAFGVEPIVFSLPYREAIGPGSPTGAAMTMILVSNGPSERLDAIRERLEGEGSFWVNERPATSVLVQGFEMRPPVAGVGATAPWRRIDSAVVTTRGADPLPTDDWPFLYLRVPALPDLNVRGMALIAVISLPLIWWVLGPQQSATRAGMCMFFLGAGFMLLEARSTVQMALLFGSTWVVNSVVIGSILLMILAANWFVSLAGPRRELPIYVLLIGSLLLNIFVPIDRFLGMPEALKLAVSCGLSFAPVFFAGVIFAMHFARSERPDTDFGLNVAGAILGGLTENLSLVLGFTNLLWLGVCYYVLAGLLGRRRA